MKNKTKNINALLKETLKKLESEAKAYTEKLGIRNSTHAILSGHLMYFIRGLPDCKKVREYLKNYNEIE